MPLLFDLPTDTPENDIEQYVSFLLSGVDVFLEDRDLWRPEEQDDGHGYMELLKTWIIEHIPPVPTVYPKTVLFFHPAAIVDTGNAIAFVPDTAQVDATQFRQNAAANGDKFHHVFTAKAGTYTLHQWGIRNTNAGVVEWSIDGEPQGTIDWYGSLVRNRNENLGSVVIPSDGEHILQGEIVGKNASSSSYIMYLNWYWLEWIQDL